MEYIDNKTTSLTNDVLSEIMSFQGSPCLSLYQSTHRQFPKNEQDSIRFGNLVKDLEATLSQEYKEGEIRNFLAPFENLSRDTEFWNHTLDGLVVLGGPGFFRILILSQPVTELALSGESFHVKPLWRYLQSVDRYQVLALSRDKIRFFEGNRHALNELEIAEGVPRSISEALGSELSSPHQTVASYGGVGGGKMAMHHGHGGKKDEQNKDTEKFFRLVDLAVIEHYSRPSNLPLILAALPEHHNLFRQISKNPLLIPHGININPFSISTEQLREMAWENLKPEYQAHLNSLSNEFKQAQANGLGSDDLAQVTNAAAGGRIDTLLIQSNIGDQECDDELDNLGEQVFKKGGHVFVVPIEKMPSDTGVAATFRY